jgi:NAD+ synthase (glutamine-hydrolysing)
MSKSLRVVLAQLNLMVGDIQGNTKKHIQAALTARDELKADVIVFPELSITGYPPEDLLLREAFINEADQALATFVSTLQGIHCVVGHPYATPQGLFNACSLIYNGSILGRYAKQQLPNHGVFDEYRYFVPGHGPCIIPIHGIPVGLVICEDLWQAEATFQAAKGGARLILSPNASPFEIDKHAKRCDILSTRAKENHLPIVYVNTIGGQDELVFDGGSMVVDEEGKLCQHAGFFNETLLPIDIDMTSAHAKIASSPVMLPSQQEKIYQALVLSVRDYIEKNRFPGVLLGVSGGIDSALTLTLAVDALGKDRVHAIMMPSRFTADISVIDTKQLTEALGVKTETISIEPAYEAFLTSLKNSFAGKKADVTEENIQARCRAMILMALSNKYGNVVLTTGNRSEMAVGYCTLYGDMAGGFAVLKDVPKTLVYELAHYRNQISAVIPERIIDRPPSAELAPDQKDEDSLPPYSLLDNMLDLYLNQGLSTPEIVAQGFDKETVEKVIQLIHRNEYKRKQAAIGPRINHKSFGRGWRYPVTNGFKG